MKKMFLYVLNMMSTSFLFLKISEFFKLIGAKGISSDFSKYVTVARHQETFGGRIERLVYKSSIVTIIFPIQYFIVMLATKTEISPISVLFLFLLGLFATYSMIGMDLSNLYSRHAASTLRISAKYTFLYIVELSAHDVGEFLKDPILRSSKDQVSIRRDIGKARHYLEILERSESSKLLEIINAPKNEEDQSASWNMLYENFPSIYNDLFTVFTPTYLQYEDQIIFMEPDEYPVYLQLWMDSFPTHPSFYAKQETGDFIITESGELQMCREDKDDED